MGAQSLDNWRARETAEGDPPSDAGTAHEDIAAELDADIRAIVAEPLSLQSRFIDKLPALLLLIVGLGWIAAVSWGVASAVPIEQLGYLRAVSWIALASGPLALIGILYLLFRRTSRREARRYARTAESIRAESARLEHVLSAISTRIAENGALLASHAAELQALGDNASGELARIGEAMRGSIEALAGSSESLAKAAETARSDMDVLLTDLPKAEAAARDVAGALRETGLGANEQAGALEAQLAAVSARAREADEALGGAAQRLAAHVSRIETMSGTASERIGESATAMQGAIDQALENAANAIEQSRQGVASQGAAMLAMVEQGRAILDRAGADSAQSLSRRLDEIGARVDAFAARLAAQDAASHALVGNLEQALARIEARFVTLNEQGVERTADLAETIVRLNEHAGEVGGALDRGATAADALTQRTVALGTAIAECAREIEETLPAALARMEAQAEHGRSLVQGTTPDAVKLAAAANEAATDLARAEALIQRQSAAVATLHAQAEGLGQLIAETGSQADSLADGAGAKLAGALEQIRDTAERASGQARAALEAAIPDAAERLAAASGEAMDRALVERVARQIEGIAATAEEAVGAANKASDRLLRQMLKIRETSDAVEARIEEAEAEAQKREQDGFSRKMSLLIESLNSAAIDVAKILSNDVTDNAWAAYLKGDRGIFARRAVRLIDAGQSRLIARHYEQEPEFREQVNRYVHDFEAMLRRALATRDGSPLGVTLLSSDVGKLYVALAQAIERLRT
jgi:uncharacterized phage infection (PIP) family protein YhgE